MNYKTHYDLLIDRARGRILDGYGVTKHYMKQLSKKKRTLQKLAKQNIQHPTPSNK